MKQRQEELAGFALSVSLACEGTSRIFAARARALFSTKARDESRGMQALHFKFTSPSFSEGVKLSVLLDGKLFERCYGADGCAKISSGG